MEKELIFFFINTNTHQVKDTQNYNIFSLERLIQVLDYSTLAPVVQRVDTTIHGMNE